MEDTRRPHVVIIGAGFGGMAAVKALQNANVDITLIDRHNYQLFQPLLVLAATGRLAADDIAVPLRDFFYRQHNINFVMAEVEKIYREDNKVATSAGEILYDYLIVAAGSMTSFFGAEEAAAENAFGLKELSDAVRLKNHLLELFERAAQTDDADLRKKMLTIICAGSGSAAVSMASAVSDFIYKDLKPRFYKFRFSEVDLKIITNGRPLLSQQNDSARAAAEGVLAKKYVEVLSDSVIEDYDGEKLILRGGEEIVAQTLIWLSGIKASPLAGDFEQEMDAAGRIFVNENLQLPGYNNIYVIGDMARFMDGDRPLAPSAAVAMEEGRIAAFNIRYELAGRPYKVFKPQKALSYTYMERAVCLGVEEKTATLGMKEWIGWLFSLKHLLKFHENAARLFIRWLVKLCSERGMAEVIMPLNVEVKTIVEMDENIFGSAENSGDGSDETKAEQNNAAENNAAENAAAAEAEDETENAGDNAQEESGLSAEERLDIATGELEKRMRHANRKD